MAKNESTKDTLKRLASARVTKAVKAIQLCGNLGRYKPTAAQSDAITGALKQAVKNTEGMLAGQTVSEDGFKLPG